MKYKETGIEWLGKVPDYWKVDKLYRLSDKMGSGGTPSSRNESYYDGNIPWVQSGDLNNSYVSETSKTISELGLKNSSAKFFKKGTVLVAMYGATIGKTGILLMDATINQACCAIQPTSKIFTKYIYYLMLNAKDYLINQSYGGGQPNISQEILKQLQISFPPKQEQIVIASYLDKACERIDEIIKIKEDQIKQIKLVKKSRIEEAIKFGLEKNISKRKGTDLEYLPEINENWKIDRFKDVACLRNEKTDIKSEVENYLELEDLSQGTGEILSKRNTLEVASKTTKFFKGDVLFGKLRPYLEKFAYADFDGLCTGEILAFEPKRIEPKFLMYILSSNWFINLCNSMSYGAKMPRVNWNTQLSKIYLPIPTKEEQKEIIKNLDKLSSKSNHLTKKIKFQIKTLKNYRKSLIHECVTGKKQMIK